MPVTDPFLPRVIVKFRDNFDLPYQDGIGPILVTQSIGPWFQLESHFPGIQIRRLSDQINPVDLQLWIDRGVLRDATYQPRKLLLYFIIDCPPAIFPEQVAAELNSTEWPGVERAYVDSKPKSPGMPACGLGYKDPPDAAAGTGGINAVSVVGIVAGADGLNQNLVDLERGWNIAHEAITHLNLGPASFLQGQTDPADQAHGTSVLAIVCGDNAAAVALNPAAVPFSGIAPNVNSVRLASYYDGNQIDEALIAVGIYNAFGALTFGDVLLLEVTPGDTGLPIETKLLCFDFIRLATALGIIVIEAAGNNGADLDQYVDPPGSGQFVLNTNDPSFKDSGAILVSAGSHDHHAAFVAGALVGHWGSYGSRVDCWAWGDASVKTAVPIRLADVVTYNCFGLTSAASAIIAGAALSVQGMAEAGHAWRLSPGQMRAILRDSAYGTVATGLDANKIGVMPDLHAIAMNALGVIEDVYMRDYVGDVGDPSVGAFCRSPDIIVRQTQSADPVAEFGDGSGTENDDGLSQSVIQGQDHFVYVRLLNRGGRDAANVNVQVFYSPPASLILPSDWQPVGQTMVASVPAGGGLTIASIQWPSDRVPPTGHYCFIALAGNAVDPAPPAASFNLWDNYLKFISANNNVVWRNFDVVSPDPPIEADGVELDLMMAGAPDRNTRMALEISSTLPPGAFIELEAPLNWIRAFGLDSPSVKRIDEETGRVAVPPSGRFTAGPGPLQEKAHVPMRLRVRIPPARRNGVYEIYVRQLFPSGKLDRGKVVGQIGWRLKRPRTQSLLLRIIRWIFRIK